VGPLGWCFVPCKDGRLGVKLDEFGVLYPERTPNWGWKLSSGMFQLTSLEHDHKVHTPEKMSEINQKRFDFPPRTIAPIIFRLAGHTYVIHAALENPTEEQRQVIINRIRLYHNNVNAPEEDNQDLNDLFINILFDEDEENVAPQRDDQDHPNNDQDHS